MNVQAAEQVTAVDWPSKTWGRFADAIKDNAETYTGYKHDLIQYMEFFGVGTPDLLVKGAHEHLEDRAIEFIKSRKGLKSVSRIRRVMAAVKVFYTMNRVTLNWPYILKHVGKGKTKKDKAYNHEQVRKALSVATPRNRVLVLLYASSGVRRGAIPELQKKHLIPNDKYGIFKIIVYEGEEEEYITYCTPECRKAIEEYFDYRARCGEKITEKSLVIRDEFNREDQFRVAAPKPITPDTISVVMTELMEKAGVRTRVKITEGMIRSQVRHEIKAIHGLRKFWDTQMTLSGASPLWIELLEGHKIKGMKHHYLRPTDEELLEGNDRVNGYLHAIDSLTINEENRLRVKVEKLEGERSQIESLRAEVESYKKRTDAEMRKLMMRNYNEGKARHPDELNKIAAELAPTIFEIFKEAQARGVDLDQIQAGVMKRLKEKGAQG